MAVCIVEVLGMDICACRRIDRRWTANRDRTSFRHIDAFAAGPDRCSALTFTTAMGAAPGLDIDMPVSLLQVVHYLIVSRCFVKKMCIRRN